MRLDPPATGIGPRKDWHPRNIREGEGLPEAELQYSPTRRGAPHLGGHRGASPLAPQQLVVGFVGANPVPMKNVSLAQSERAVGTADVYRPDLALLLKTQGRIKGFS
jgi:hypothetical protein